MKNLMLMLTLLSTVAMAGKNSGPVTKFTCQTREGAQAYTVAFAFTQFDTDAMEFVYPNDEDQPPIAISPEKDKDGYYPLLSSLNGQGGDARLKEKGLRLFGDDDGCNFTDFFLYRNSGFTKGYVASEAHCSSEPERHYAIVHCTVTTTP